MSISERRLEGRFLCADLVRVNYWGPDDSAANPAGFPENPRAVLVDAVLEDISALGACVEVAVPIPLATLITLTIGESRFPGRVCYCVFRDYGYFVGIRFSEETSWSSDTVVPRHLTRLDAIADTNYAELTAGRMNEK